MKGFIHKTLIASALFISQVSASALPTGLWEGVESKLALDYYMLSITEGNEHYLYVSAMSSQLKRGSIYRFSDNDVTCEKELCHLLLTENKSQNQNVELQLVISTDHLQTNFIVRDSDQRPIFPGSIRLKKQRSGIPLGDYFNKNPLPSPGNSSEKALYGVWMGSNIDDDSAAIYRMNISETGESSIEYLKLGARGDLPLKVSFDAANITYDKSLPKATLRLDGKEGACTKLEYEFHQNGSLLNAYKTCYMQRQNEVTTTSYLRLTRVQ